MRSIRMILQTGSWIFSVSRLRLRAILTKSGEYVDEWGCVFENRQKGVIGEVKRPVVEDWADLSRVHFPKGWLTLDRDKINRFCQDTTRFVQAGFCPRPFEQLQFLRGQKI